MHVSNVELVAWLDRRDVSRTFASDKRDELADTLLHALLCFLGNLCVFGQRILHDAGDWSKVANVSIDFLRSEGWKAIRLIRR